MGQITASSAGAVVLGADGLDALLAALRSDGYGTRGPVVRDGAVVPGDVLRAADLPEGARDRQAPGRYELTYDGGRELFGWAVGPQSLKAELFPPRSVVWSAERTPDGAGPLEASEPDDTPLAYIGARPCELAAEAVLGRVLAGGAFPDESYRRRRERAFLVVAECTRPAATCFCGAMGSGPAATGAFDIALTELPADGAAEPHAGDPACPRYLARPGSVQGASLLAALPGLRPTDAEWSRRAALLEGATQQMSGRLDPTDLPQLLAASIDHPMWTEIASRCLACGNCTMVCPTCFCSSVADTSDLFGTLRRERRWSSCFESDHSYIHGGPVRASTASRYRQWMTHKLASWHEQFGESGCVGCGRCITWCPAGIDITAEVRALQAGAPVPRPEVPEP